MIDDIMNFDIPQVKPASIKVIGVGGGGGNAVNHMYELGIKDVEFILCNTDAQALAGSPVPTKIHIGELTTHGRGAGNNASVGKESAIEAINEIEKVLADNTQMVFITAGMGGGTGTGAAPVIAKAAKDLGILTVAIVTVPFKFEGKHRITQAIKGLEELQKNVDSLLIINNEKLREMFGNLALTDAFIKADNVLAVAAKGIAEIITLPGTVNVDFADVCTVMSNSGVALMGAATANGENRAIDAITMALNSPLLNNANILGAKNILLNFSSGEKEITMDEMTDITDYIIEKAGNEVNMIWGSVKDNSLTDDLRVTIIVTGFEMDNLPDFSMQKKPLQEKISLEGKPQISKPQNTKPETPERIVIDLIERPSTNTVQTTLSFESENAVESVSVNSNQSTEVQDLNTLKQTKPLSEKNTTQEWQWSDVKGKEDISQWEQIPAYLRTNIGKIPNIDTDEEEISDSNTVSRFKISKNNKGGVSLKENNSFLDENVD